MSDLYLYFSALFSLFLLVQCCGQTLDGSEVQLALFYFIFLFFIQIGLLFVFKPQDF